jgi:exodeoxyribonuclease VII, large subunit
MILDVSELNEKARAVLETNFSEISVRGEISRITKHASGHWYFTLKDERAAISCAMFRGANSHVKFSPKDGQKVILTGKISIYAPSGSYQLNATKMELEGAGDLDAKFRALLEKLRAMGLFDASHKKPLPRFPRRVALITSASSAAFADLKNRIISSGYFLAKFSLFDSLMQGEMAASSVINSLEKADKMGFDAIIIARGGGSKEDLWCFNDEHLAHAIFAAQTPVISAIGHEIDFSISDYVADHRSITPTAAIDDLLPRCDDLEQHLDILAQNFSTILERKFRAINEILERKKLQLKAHSIEQKIEAKLTLLSHLKQNFSDQISTKLAKFDYIFPQVKLKFNDALWVKFRNFEHILELKKANFDAKRQFLNTTRGLISIQKDGKRINLSQLSPGDTINLTSHDTQRWAQILS